MLRKPREAVQSDLAKDSMTFFTLDTDFETMIAATNVCKAFRIKAPAFFYQ